MGAITAEQVEGIVKEALGRTIEELRNEFGRPAQKQREENLGSVLHTVSRNGVVAILPEEPKGKGLARFMRAIAAGKFDQKRSLDWATKHYGAESDLCKSLEAQDFAAGGVMVPDDLQAELIPLLRASTVIRGGGARVIPMPNGTFGMNFQATAMTARYEEELAAITPSQPSYGRLKLAAKKLTGLVPISNDLLKFASTEFDALVRDDIVQTFSRREDIAFIRDDGSVSTPKGLRHLADPANVVDRTLDGGLSTLETVTNDLADAVERLETADVTLLRPLWIFTPRTKWFLMKLRDGNGNLVYAPEMRTGTLLGMPFATTTQIPNNLGVAGDETEVYFVEMSRIMIGDAVQMELKSFDGGAYDDGSGVITSGISTDETVVRGISQHDIGARQRGREISIITAVDWIGVV